MEDVTKKTGGARPGSGRKKKEEFLAKKIGGEFSEEELAQLREEGLAKNRSIKMIDKDWERLRSLGGAKSIRYVMENFTNEDLDALRALGGADWIKSQMKLIKK